MSGTIRFDDEHIVKFTLLPESLVVILEVIVGDNTYTKEVSLLPIG